MEVEPYRLAQFFLLIGVVLLVLFFGTDQSQNPQFGLFFLAALITGLGAFLMFRAYKPPPPSGRFQTLRRMMSRRSEPPAAKKPEAQGGAAKKKWFGFGKKSKQ
jgi:hypothetical protein